MAKLLKRVSLLALVVLSVVVVAQRATLAQVPSNVSSRVSRLESENTMLRNRLNRLESQVSRLSREVGSDLADPDIAIAPDVTPRSSDPMFDRLATLAIEQRERIDELEARLTRLEAQISN